MNILNLFRSKPKREHLLIAVEENGIMPSKAYATDAGYDLSVPHDFNYKDHYNKTTRQYEVDLKVMVCIPNGYAGIIKPRSSVAKRGLHVQEGVIDAGYTGNLKICCKYHGTSHGAPIKAGERICQLVIVPLAFLKVVKVNERPQTKRGANGFGSTGEF